jgi:hypothetical protein
MKSMKAACCVFLGLAACAPGGGEYTGSGLGVDAGAAVASAFFDLDRSPIPPDRRANIQAAVAHVEAVLAAEPLLARLRDKADWRFAEPGTTGAELVRRIRERRDQQNAPVRPPLRFYTPPYIGVDVCGGKNRGPFGRTRATGCTDRDGTIHLSLWHLEDDPLDTAEFLAHEWMHAADYGHGNNNGQATVEKRNSVPIYVGCLVAAHPDARRMDLCALSLAAANRLERQLRDQEGTPGALP